MKQYENIKTVPIQWLTTLPQHWDCEKIGTLFSERKTKVSDIEYAPLSVAKIGVVPQLANAAKTNAGDNRKLVCTGDFVINSRSDRKGSCGVSELDGSVSLINIVLTPRSEWNHRYVHYLLRSQPFSEEYYRNGRGIVADLWTTRFTEMKSIQLPIPPRDEQDQIVRFLDWKVSRINKLISIKQKQIEAFAEQRSAIITKLTHYGMKKNTELIDSEYAWLGKIPATWHLRPFSKIAKVRSNLVSPDEYMDDIQISPASIEKNTGKILYMQSVRDAGFVSNNHKFFEGQIIYSKIRPLLNKVTIAPCDGLCSADMYPIETVLITKYLMYFMLSQNFLCQLSMTGNRVKMPKINQEELSSILILYPSQDEQLEIVETIEKRCEKVDDVISKVKNTISFLQELRTRLIADVVTGKIDVRDIEIPDYEYVEEETETSDDAIDEKEITEEE